MPFTKIGTATAVAITLAGGGLIAAAQQGRHAEGRLSVAVLSGRPDMVTGGDALVAIGGVTTGAPVVSVSGKDVSSVFKPQPGRGWVGLVAGLPVGKSMIAARVGSASATLDVTNYPITGPVFSGPHQTPFVCQTDAWNLGPATDANCSAPTRVEWRYKSTAPVQGRGASPFKVLADPNARPADMDEATVNGKRVPYIVRVETGTINRAVYQIAQLRDGWNERLVYTFGGSCMAGYIQGSSAGTVLSDLHLSAGYAVASSSLNVFGNNCNGVISAETLMMVKERFIETIGVPKHTIGWGGSGGAMAQYEIAQNYPGLLDGIMPSATFPDATTYFIESEDCRLLLRPYLNKTTLTEEQKRAIGGFSTWNTCSVTYAGRPGRITPTDCDADIPKELRYDPVTNPKGARCSIYDGMVNVFGRDAKTGFARRPHDNVGVQYGLAALNAKVITVGDFLDLNEHIGGFDVDSNWQPARTVGDPEAIRTVYASGKTVTGAGGLRDTPIIDIRNYTDPTGDFHESYHSFKARARLIKTNGHADNQILVKGQGASFTRQQSEFLAQMDRWLDAIDADTSTAARAVKVAKAKPADLTDACWTPEGRKIVEKADYAAKNECNSIYPPHSAPRLVAGAPLADDIWKCALKPIDWRDYSMSFTDAEKARLQKIFPAGVCDWSKPGQGFAPLRGTWQRY
jgi:hypothetical protein